MLGEDHRPLVVRKGKRLKEEVKRREPPPETPVVDVSRFLEFAIKTVKSVLNKTLMFCSSYNDLFFFLFLNLEQC